MITTSDSVANLMTALAAAQVEMGAALKGSVNPHFKSRYADLAAVIDACRPHLAKAGIAIVQFPMMTDAGVTVFTRLYCKDEFIECVLSAQGRDTGPQAIGSVITYLRRYSLMALVGLAPDDDDGEAAEGRSVPKLQRPPAATSHREESEEIPQELRTIFGEQKDVQERNYPQERRDRFLFHLRDVSARRNQPADWNSIWTQFQSKGTGIPALLDWLEKQIP